MKDFDIERLKRLPKRDDETWQGGFVRLPFWIDGERPEPFRPWAPFWTSLKTGLVITGAVCAPEERSHEAAFASFAAAAARGRAGGFLPGGVEVIGEGLRQFFAERLSPLGVAVGPAGEGAAIKRALGEMARARARDEGKVELAGLLEAPGMTVERLRGFAGAAAAFYNAAVWTHVSGEDLIRVEGPAQVNGLSHFTVLGEGGRAFGLGFFDSEEDMARMIHARDPGDYFDGRPSWAVHFDDMMGLPIADADAWEDLALPVAGADAYPWPIHVMTGRELRRPDAAELEHLEGILAALAVTTEAEFDTGRWTKTVALSRGTREVAFSLPELLKPVDLGSGGGTPQTRSLAVIDQALRAIGRRRRIKLAQMALEIHPDCVDAHGILAAESVMYEDKRLWLQKGVEAGERTLGAAFFEENEGRFGERLEARPFLQVLFELAGVLEVLDRPHEAAQAYARLVALDQDDRVCARDPLLPLLLEAGDNDGARLLWERFRDGAPAVWDWAGVLIAFREEGPGPAAEELLGDAIRANRHVVPLLLGEEDDLPFPEGPCAPGGHNEASDIAQRLYDSWQDTAGAIAWLEEAGRRKIKNQARNRRKKR